MIYLICLKFIDNFGDVGIIGKNPTDNAESISRSVLNIGNIDGGFKCEHKRLRLAIDRNFNRTTSTIFDDHYSVGQIMECE